MLQACLGCRRGPGSKGDEMLGAWCDAWCDAWCGSAWGRGPPQAGFPVRLPLVGRTSPRKQQQWESQRMRRNPPCCFLLSAFCFLECISTLHRVAPSGKRGSRGVGSVRLGWRRARWQGEQRMLGLPPLARTRRVWASPRRKHLWGLTSWGHVRTRHTAIAGAAEQSACHTLEPWNALGV